ncbi:MAG: hypothetical protein N4A49_08915 [Marinifilaceae bacterium]|jgi:hypothetical protein|nr:hypothetical protein [Marinifilaceae bacterium]
MKYYTLTFFLIIISNINLFSQNYLSLNQKFETLHNGFKSTANTQFYYNISKSELISVYEKPEKMIQIKNNKGELKIYFPKKNSVAMIQDNSFSTSNDFIYYFINNETQSLGLEKEGFTLIDSKQEGKYVVLTWMAPAKIKIISTIKVVYDGDKPIYSEYKNANNNAIKKIYYYNYTREKNFQIPMKVTEISYKTRTDSIIKRMSFTDLKLEYKPSSDLFNFKIPEDAKLEEIPTNK